MSELRKSGKRGYSMDRRERERERERERGFIRRRIM